jgi:hypothetical protein
MTSWILRGLAVGLLGVHGLQHVFDAHFPFAAIESPSVNVSTGNLIFNALASLLQQLPNTLHPNGHTIVPAVVRAQTTLFHAYPSIRDNPVRVAVGDVILFVDSRLQCSPEWLAFQPEMSMAISTSVHFHTSLQADIHDNSGRPTI